MIELDMFSSKSGPVVSHGTTWKDVNIFCSPTLSLEAVCEQISGFITTDTSPVILDLELNYLKKERRRIQDLTRKIFEDELGPFVPSGKINFMTEPPSAYMGNVIVTCGSGLDPESELSDYVNIDFSKTWWYKNRSYEGALQTLNNFDIMRSYPSNRVKSTNFDPIPLLGAGVQFVAMNYQNADEHLKAYRAWFAGQDLVGYRPIK